MAKALLAIKPAIKPALIGTNFARIAADLDNWSQHDPAKSTALMSAYLQTTDAHGLNAAGYSIDAIAHAATGIEGLFFAQSGELAENCARDLAKMLRDLAEACAATAQLIEEAKS